MCSGGKKVSESHHNKQQIAGISLRDVRGEIGGGMGKNVGCCDSLALGSGVKWEDKPLIGVETHKNERENFSSVCIHNKHCHYVFITLIFVLKRERKNFFNVMNKIFFIVPL